MDRIERERLIDQAINGDGFALDRLSGLYGGVMVGVGDEFKFVPDELQVQSALKMLFPLVLRERGAEVDQAQLFSYLRSRFWTQVIGPKLGLGDLPLDQVQMVVDCLDSYPPFEGTPEQVHQDVNDEVEPEYVIPLPVITRILNALDRSIPGSMVLYPDQDGRPVRAEDFHGQSEDEIRRAIRNNRNRPRD